MRNLCDADTMGIMLNLAFANDSAWQICEVQDATPEDACSNDSYPSGDVGHEHDGRDRFY